MNNPRINPHWAKLPLFDRKGWGTLPFGAFADSINEHVEPCEAAEDIYVGLEHLDSQDLHIRRRGKGSDVIGTKLRFRKGDIIFGRRRAYQRKLAVAEFDGICSAHAMVVRAKPDLILPEFLPFLMMSDRFMNRAVEISVGSLSPTINWKALKREEFALPPLDQQHHIVEILWAADMALNTIRRLEADAATLKSQVIDDEFAKLHLEVQQKIMRGSEDTVSMATVDELLADGKSLTYGILQPGADDPTGIPMLRAIDIDDGRLSGTQILRVNRNIEADYERTRLQGGEVLLSVMGTIGRTIVAPKEWAGWNVNRALAVIRLNPRVQPEFFYQFIRSPQMQMQLKKDSIGTAQLRINLSHFRKYSLPLPSKKRQEEVVAIISTTERTQRCISLHLNRFSALFKSLINALIQ